MASESGYGIEPGPKPLPADVKKRRVNICLSPIGMRRAKKKRPLESCHFLDI
jgi:hypothetical protein